MISDLGINIVEFDNKLCDYRFFLQRLSLKMEKAINVTTKIPPKIKTINATTLNYVQFRELSSHLEHKKPH